MWYTPLHDTLADQVQALPIGRARALYEYTRQTEEELSFPDGAILDVYDSSEQDWTLVGLDGEFGFVPSNYIDLTHGLLAGESTHQQYQTTTSSSLQQRPVPGSVDQEQAGLVAAQAGLHETIAPLSIPTPRLHSPSSHALHPGTTQKTPPLDSNDRPGSSHDPSPGVSVALGPKQAAQDVLFETKAGQPRRDSYDEDSLTFVNQSPTQDGSRHTRRSRNRDSILQASPAADHMRASGAYHLYNINEMLSVLGKKKKMPLTLGVNIATRIISITPEKASDGRSQEWSAEKMTHHSREGKHVFLELVQPSRSVDFHAGAKDTAEEIIGALDELAGLIRADGLQDVIMASATTSKKGLVLYDFVAQADDELTVDAGDEVTVVIDGKGEEWLTVKRLKNGMQGIVPSSYVQIQASPTHVTPVGLPGHSRSIVEINRLEEKRLAKDAVLTGTVSEAELSSPSSSKSHVCMVFLHVRLTSPRIDTSTCVILTIVYRLVAEQVSRWQGQVSTVWLVYSN